MGKPPTAVQNTPIGGTKVLRRAPLANQIAPDEDVTNKTRFTFR